MSYKIKAHEIKPGMIITRPVDHTCLVVAVEGRSKIEFTYLDEDCTMGRMVGTINGDDDARVLIGEERKIAFSKIKRTIFDNLFRAKMNVDLIRLIEEMHKDR